MPNPLALLGDSLKATSAIVPRLPFATVSSTSSRWPSPTFWPNGLTQGAYLGGTGSDYDFNKLGSDLLQNTVVAAVVDTYARALPEAPLMLEQFEGPNKTDGTGGEWQRVEQHEALDIFNGNPHLSDSDIWSLTAAYRMTRGLAHWVLFYNSSKSRPVEIWPWMPERVRSQGDKTNLISGYEIQSEEGEWREVSPEQVIHFRHMPSPYNLREGWSPLFTGRAQVVGDNAVSQYHAAILLNAGVMSLLISIKQSQAQGAAVTVTPEQFNSMLDRLRRKYIGNKAAAGDIDGLSLPLDIQKMGYSPDEMAVDKLLNYYETRLSVLMGVDPMVTGLGSGTTQKTYANYGEAINDFWERRVVPDRNKDAAVLNRQLLPQFIDESQIRNFRYAFDFSKVAALQENTDQLFTRWKGVYDSGGCDLYTYQTKIGLSDVPDDYKELWAKPPQKMGQEQPQPAAPALAQGGEK